MKILHINKNDMYGGAARAAFRIHEGLLGKNVDSTFFVQKKTVIDDRIIVPTGKINKLKIFINERVDLLIKKVCRNTTKTPWNINQFIFDITKSILENKYDVINLHWINEGFLSIDKIAKIKQPIVWTLHDSWAFTGGCNIPYDCKKYEVKCSKCKQLLGQSKFDLSKYVFQAKIRAYKCKMVIVCPSNWLATCARNSFLLKNMDIRVIPNGIDTDKYQPCDKNFAKKSLGLEMNKKIILFGAMNATSDQNKGYGYLYQAVRNLYERTLNGNEVEVVVFGSKLYKGAPNFGFKTWYTGRLYDDITLKLLYSAADVMVVPSKSENLPNTIMEAMACGTPCVAFNVGGISDLIDHKINGYLARPFEPIDLAGGIRYILDNNEKRGILSFNARKKIIKVFDINIVANQYKELYEEILKKKTGN